MINNKDITNRISQLTNLKDLIGTYEEIAALRMRKIRSSVLQAREFNNGLGSVFHEVKNSHTNQIKSLMKEKKIEDKKGISLIHKNDKKVAVFLAANTRLYGDIILRTYESFMDFTRKNPSDIVIIGRVGRELFTDQNPNTLFTYFEFPDTNTPKEDIAKLTQHLIQYENIYIFYGKFESVTSQKPNVLDVYGEENQPQINEADSGPKMKYLFEPSLEEVMVYFESEIFASIISQALNESELAKYAARMITLDATTENVKNDLKKVSLQKRILLHRQINKKQVESLIGMSLWRR